ncbi:hypothetical protein MYAM1_000102 [Malassezia yamatoensis]|uniref:Histone deacetylase interacting domain-containing protein n=1 Tax=Malassezia yamatoensis TaxID=253288 RepID=A0AAJ6CH31_9BASI|nr:hypothetical protein MYAM1_000102 [Malassezia yamatoensis]
MATLNVRDALSYLDQVKVQFTDHPDVYNRFLDIMKDFKSQAIDTPGVIERVSMLFRGQPSLIQGFNTFLPPGYRIECSVDQNDANMITVTTPSGTTTQSLGGHGIAGAINRITKGGNQAESSANVSSHNQSSAINAPPMHNSSGMPIKQMGQRTPPMGGNPPNIASGHNPLYGAMPSGSASEYENAGMPSHPYARPGASSGMNNHDRSSTSLSGRATTSPSSNKMMGHNAAANAPHASMYELNTRSNPMSSAHSNLPSSSGPTGAIAPGANGDAARPPVEFNHAINYVNKIKQRFAGDPDTYKQFLEILQTYQKEQRPIHEVYAQVTVLFDHAKDLLDEFKQFLPDTGAQGGAGASGGLFGMLGHVTNGMAAPLPASDLGANNSYETVPAQQGTPSAVGRKKRSMSGTEELQAPPPANESVHPSTMSKSSSRSKRSKHGKAESGPRAPMNPYRMQNVPSNEMHDMYGAPMQPGGVPHAYDMPPEAPPGYLPGQMYDMPPYAPPHMVGGANHPGPHNLGNGAMAGDGVMQMPHMATMDEVAFFERVKKHIDDRATYMDFLKLLNLYTQDVIDLATLVDRVSLFLGGQPELLAAFKSLCGYDMGKHGWLENEEPVLENVPALERERFDLSTQRSYGPSYRKLPDSEINLACSGRDPLCWEVLNDSWVSHPTWASEGESFNPHKKNVFEDALYRSEEERHEYDYHIEANLRTIALLEPIAARIAVMDADERASFRLKPGLGGQSKSIYQRIIKKVYGRNHGLEVIAALHDNPSVAVPVVLARLKQKDEEWKRAQREWNKVWREVDARNFYKALDHQGINFKSTDKRTITTKAFVNEIETLRTEQQQRRLALDPSLPALAPRFQLSYSFEDGQVVKDVLRLAVQFTQRITPGFSTGDKSRVLNTFQQLLPRLLHVDRDVLDSLLLRKPQAEDDSNLPEENKDQDEDPSSLKKASAPASQANHAADSASGSRSASPSVQQQEPHASTWHVNTSMEAMPPHDAMPVPKVVDFFANTTLYVFVRLLQLLYSRLHTLKMQAIEMAQKTPSDWSKVNPLAAELGLADTATGPANLVSQIAASLPGTENHRQKQQDQAPAGSTSRRSSPSKADAAIKQVDPSQYYAVLLELVERLIDHEIDQATFEEGLRFMYGTDGYRAMTLDKVIHAFVKTALTIATDTKCQELLGIFDATHHALQEMQASSSISSSDDGESRSVPVYKRLIASRMEAEHVLGRDEHLFRIEMVPRSTQTDHSVALPSQTMQIQLLSHDDLTLKDPQDDEQRWLQYIASYCLYAPTEGIPAECHAPLLKRNLPAEPELLDERDVHYIVRNALDIRVCMRTYRLFFVQGTDDVFARIRTGNHHQTPTHKVQAARKQRWDNWLEARRAVIEEHLEAPQAEQHAQPSQDERKQADSPSATNQDSPHTQQADAQQAAPNQSPLEEDRSVPREANQQRESDAVHTQSPSITPEHTEQPSSSTHSTHQPVTTTQQNPSLIHDTHPSPAPREELEPRALDLDLHVQGSEPQKDAKQVTEFATEPPSEPKAELSREQQDSEQKPPIQDTQEPMLDTETSKAPSGEVREPTLST